MFKSYLLMLSAALALGLPSGSSCAPSPKTPTLPQTGGATNLPAPPAGSKLLHIALGFGIQNYTCASVGATPTATGALAMLYDITDFYPGQSKKSLSQKDWDGLTSRALWTQNVPLNFNKSSAGRVDARYPGASQTNPFTKDAPLCLRGMRELPFLGHHLFTSAGVPNFILEGGKINMLAGKNAGVDAPTNADKGRDGTGAVAWLQLGAKDGSIGNAKLVYRVLTAGGNSHGCAKAAGQDSTSYTAQYWFYG
ncbi:malate dehydrogenase [Pochonia chlamydosporia 170]|uniref:Malate dehydrogenase n=1 Tax=Pochonia chlamydosporia 170 TaxID=1380566 RepID=A0A179F839_METCM|nr:malate dehydrogenase [Pochonia chlamydosporia 170]OAQ61587.1 malate dehydrogenase [Pochonia chlamydosporia 170]